jgi:threonine synthase
MDEMGRMLKMPDMDRLKNDVFSMSVNDEQTLETMKTALSDYKTIIEPHGAVGLFAMDFFLDTKLMHEPEHNFIGVCLETAHPAKFPEALDGIGIEEAGNMPQKLQKILEKKDENYLRIGNDYAEFRKLLLLKF